MDNYQSPTMEYAAGDFQSENQRITTVIPVVVAAAAAVAAAIVVVNASAIYNFSSFWNVS
ncbi:hypothetical protein [Clostridium disporicum]|uniref:hypothetical protein n=1 Tax=Clostridium disporicum TaxID=84024 RepID=UPI0006C3B946|nr:hypothetical protein [Clostridium disporicum]CUO51940.1 Uncharacterised protein [Clostridium disporicum]